LAVAVTGKEEGEDEEVCEIYFQLVMVYTA
jgi:hypothetical protein